MSVAFGIAGWSYADWKGWVYPAGCKDTLRFCARYVDCIEINSTFYRIPDARMTSSWAKRTADLPEFFFTAKLPRVFTHEMRIDHGDVAATHAGLAPLVEAGKLRALLLQFSYRLTAEPKHRDHVARLADAFRDVAPLVVEVRHASWSDEEALESLDRSGLSVAHLDYPGAQSGFGGKHLGPFGPHRLAYLRLHGRNHKAWFDKDAGRDAVYDYCYSRSEVEHIQRRLEQIAAAAQQTIAVGNNHFRGQELKVVLELMAASQQRKVDVPPLLVERYRDLAPIAQDTSRGLFG